MNDERKTKAQLLKELRELREHKQTEEALRTASQYTRSLIEASLDPLVTISPRGKITDVNQATEAVTGVPRQRLIGSDFSDYFTEPEKAREGYKQVFSAGTVSDYPLTIRHTSGRLTDVLYNASVYRNESGEVQGVFAAARDVTEHKQAEQQLRLFSQAVESSIEGIAMGDPDNRITYVNETFARMFGYSREELIGKDIASIYSEEQIPSLGKALRATMEGGWTGELIGKRKDGELFPVAISSSKIVDDRGNLVAHMASQRDITERKRVEEALRESEDQLRLITDSLPVLISYVDSEQRYRFNNRLYEEWFGVSRTAAAGRHLSEVLGDQVYQRIRPYVEAALSGREVTFENEVPYKDAGTRYVSVTYVPHCDRNAQVRGFFALAGDITERKRDEAALRESEELFRTVVDASKDAMVAINAEGLVTIFNPAAEAMFGRRNEDVIGQSLDCLMPEEHRTLHREYVKSYFATGSPHNTIGKIIELPALRSDGEVFPVELSLSTGRRGGERFVLAVIRDITARKRAEEDLSKFKTISDQVRYGAAISDLEGRLIYVNSAFAEMHGYAPEELNGKNLSAFHTQEQMEYVNALNEQLRREGSFAGKEVSHKRRDGTVFPTLMHASLIRDDSGEPLFLSGMAIDISERKRAEEDLRRRDAILEAVAYAAQRFFRAASGDRDVDAVLARLGRAAGVSRVYVFENHTDVGGELLVSQRYEWVAPGVTAQFDNPDMQAMPWFSGPMRRWAAILGGGEVISGNVRDFPPGEQQVLSPQDIQSILAVPIFVHDEWWGVIGFDECTRERQWSAAETETLKVAGATLGAAIQRKRAEEALERSEARFRGLVETTSDWVWEVDRSGVYTYASPQASNLLGYAPEDVVGKTPFDFMPSDEAKRVGKWFADITKSRKPFAGLENTNLHRDGRRVVLETSGVPVLDAAGDLLGYRGIDRDITERKRAEEALKETSALLQSIMDSATEELIVATDHVGTILCWNEGARKLLDYEAEEVVGKQSVQIFHTEEYLKSGRMDINIKRMIATGEPLVEELIYVAKDGRTFPVQQIITPRFGEDGEFVGMLGLARDITERKRAEEALKESEERYRTLVENVADGVGLVVNGEISYANPALCAMLGRTAQEIQGRSPEEFHVPEQQQPTAERVQAVLAGARVPLAKSTYLRPDGSHVEIEITSTRIRWAGRPALLSVIRDVTQRQRAEEEKASLKEQLYQAQKMQAVGHVAAGIAHDFGSLLGVMRGGIRRLRAESAPDDAMRETLDLIEQAEQEATGVTQSLLMFSRRLPTERRPVELAQLIKESQPILRHLLPRVVELHVDTGCQQPCWVKADRTQLQQILLNLVINARDALPAGGMVEITVTSAGDDSRDSAELIDQSSRYSNSRDRARPLQTKPSSTSPAVRLAVRDTGVGIPPDVRPHIFEPFFTTRPAGRGTGLGLATVQSITRDHGGRIEVETTVGHGSTFTVVLPGISADSATAAAAPPVPAGRGEVVLLEESNRHIRRLITSTLRSWNYQVVLPAEGGSAYESLQQQTERVALLILDTDPPAHDRCECLRRIRAAGHRTPVILTVQVSDPEIDDLLDDSTVVLHKPFQMSELGACLSELLASQPPRTEPPRTEPRP